MNDGARSRTKQLQNVSFGFCHVTTKIHKTFLQQTINKFFRNRYVSTNYKRQWLGRERLAKMYVMKVTKTHDGYFRRIRGAPGWTHAHVDQNWNNFKTWRMTIVWNVFWKFKFGTSMVNNKFKYEKLNLMVCIQFKMFRW